MAKTKDTEKTNEAVIPKLELHHLVKSHCLCQYLQVSAELLMQNHSFTIAASGTYSLLLRSPSL